MWISSGGDQWAVLPTDKLSYTRDREPSGTVNRAMWLPGSRAAAAPAKGAAG